VRLSLAVIISFLLLLSVSAQPVAAQTETLIFLVRHAERADDGPEGNRMAMDPQMAEDPPLSVAGQDRAALLAEMLSDAGITHVHSTDYRRTRETAGPAARGTGIEIATYDASDLEGFAKKLRSTPGRHLVVGHSNTTPGLVEALGGDPGSPIQSLEYDRLYLVIVSEADVGTVLIRFGAAF
jgi:phosphohistidine phosphatase SixA